MYGESGAGLCRICTLDGMDEGAEMVFAAELVESVYRIRRVEDSASVVDLYDCYRRRGSVGLECLSCQKTGSERSGKEHSMNMMKHYLKIGTCIMCLAMLVGVPAMAGEPAFGMSGDSTAGQEPDGSGDVAADIDNMDGVDGAGGVVDGGQDEQDNSGEADETKDVTNAGAADEAKDGSDAETVDENHEAVVKDVEANSQDGEPAESVTGSITGESLVVEPEEKEVHTIAVQIPKNLNFVMDPYNLCEKGTVWSESRAFRNNGETAVRLTLEDVKCILNSGITVAESDAREEDIVDSSDKVLLLQLIMGNGDVLDITTEGSEFEVILNPGEELSISVGGVLSREPQESWQSGDVSIEMTYDIQIAE